MAQDMSKDVNHDLQIWLDKIPIGSEDSFGFNTREEFSQATTGIPIEVFRLNPEYLKSLKPDNSQALIATGEWRVPVMVSGQPRMLLTIVKVNNEWKIVDMGAKLLAEELNGFIKNHGNNNMDSLRMIRIFEMKCDLLFTGNPHRSEEQLTVYPLKSAYHSLTGLQKSKVDRMGIADLFPMVQENLFK